MNILTKILMMFDIFYVTTVLMGVYICKTHYNGNVDEFWDNVGPYYKLPVIYGLLIIFLQLIYMPVMVIFTGHL